MLTVVGISKNKKQVIKTEEISIHHIREVGQMDLIGKYEEKPFPRIREIIVDTQEHSLKRHHMKGLIELDVTKGRGIIRKHEEKTGETWSFTGWIMKCIGQAVNDHKHVQAMRKGKKTLLRKICSDIA